MKILLVVDMQNDFIDGALGTSEAAAVLPYVKERIVSAKDELILFTQDTHGDDYLQTQEGRNLPIEHCIINTPGWEIHPSLINAFEENPSSPRISGLKNNSLIKNTFGSKALITLLEDLAEKNEIERVEILGLCTDICVISNAMLIKTYFPETEIVVNEKGCAGVSPESHNTAIAAMKSCQVKVI